MGSVRGKPGASEETRHELLEAGFRLLLRDGLPAGFNVKLADVVAEANRSTGAAYQIWKSQDEYRLDLAVHVAQNVSYADPTVLTDVVASATDDAEDITAFIAAVGRTYFEYLVARPEFYLALHFWATSDNLPAQVSDAVGHGYQQIQASFEAFFGLMLDRYDIALSPAKLADLTTAATAVTEGMALRHRFAGSDVERTRITRVYVDLLTSLLPALTSQ